MATLLKTIGFTISGLLSLVIFTSLSLKVLAAGDGGWRWIIVSSITCIIIIILFIAAPVITVSPNNTIQLEGSNVMFQCEAISEPLYTVQWQFNETFINNNNDYLINQSTGELTVFNITLTDTGIYTCIVENIHGNDSASATLSVQGTIIIIMITMRIHLSLSIYSCSTIYSKSD